MAKPPPKDDFLGGFSFNEAGAGAAEADSAADDTGPIRMRWQPTPAGIRYLIIVVIVLALVTVLYVVSDYGLGGVVHTQGHGVSPDERPTAPPRNF